ncbi:MAG: MFS transporter [Betaproteobacteria bacterium]|nr:MFS transporter [Betaproteobacteria bacterium]
MKRPAFALALVCLGAMVAPLDTAVNVAFPAIAAAFGVAPRDIVWVIIAFVFTQSLSSLVFGRLGDLYGHRRMFLIGMAGSVLAHGALAMAGDFLSLVVLRALQGAAVGMAMACAPALVSMASSPAERPKALALYASAISGALALGPLAGGWLIDWFGWPGVFLYRAPLALLVLFLAPWGLTIAAQTTGAATRPTAAAVAWSALRARPFLGLQGASVFVQGALFSIMLWVPFALAGWPALPVAGAGALIALFPAGSLMASLWLVRYRGAASGLRSQALVRKGQWFAAAGLALIALVLPAQSSAMLAVALWLAGVGMGIFQVGYQEGTLEAVPADNRGLAGSLINVTRLLGIVLGAILSGAVGASLGVVMAIAFSAAALAVWTCLFLIFLQSAPSARADPSEN